MNVHAEIITIGDEILIGQTVDTNTAWMGNKLSDYGVDVERVTSIRDTREAITETLDAVKKSTKIVLITGGLGPTKDDLTKHVLNKYFGGQLELNQEALNNVEILFGSLGLTVAQVNRDQALLPNNCTVLINKMGTASGMLFKKDNTYYISMPGVPYEMKYLMQNHVLPFIDNELTTGHILHKTIMTHGVGESMLAERIKDWEEQLPPPLKLAYLPSPGLVKLRISAKGDVKEELEKKVAYAQEQLYKLIGDIIFGEDDDSIEKLTGNLLKERKATLATAESCTGGNIAKTLTSVAGSSEYFVGSIVAYSNAIKENLLNVRVEDLNEHGAVSETVVRQMAEDARNKMQTTYALATSGIAGPGGGSKDKPVGTVWIALATPHRIISKKFLFGKDRLRNIKRSTFMALSILRDELIASH